jgi:lysophospholipase L1-like esterase
MQQADIIKPPYFQTPADGRRDEFNIKNGVIVTNKTPVDILFTGDSITHLWELNAYFREFGFVVNRGIAGDTVDILAKRFEADVIQLRPKVCVMKIGINNTWCLDDSPNPVPADEIYSVIIENYIKILQMCKVHHLTVVVCSVLPVSTGEIRNELVIKVNKRLQELCKQYRCTYVDYHSHLTKEDGKTLRDGLSDDGLHPHVIGYNIMAEILKPVLKGIFAQ